MDEQESITRKARGSGRLVKIARTIIWIIILLFLSIGAGLICSGMGSEAMANGTAEMLLGRGKIILVVSLILFGGNFVWGTMR